MANQANTANYVLSSKLRLVGWLTRAQLISDESLIPVYSFLVNIMLLKIIRNGEQRLFLRPVSEVILLVCVGYICCFWIWHLIDARLRVYWSQ